MQMHRHHELSGSWRMHRAPFALIRAMQTRACAQLVAQTDLHVLSCLNMHTSDTKANANQARHVACHDRRLHRVDRAERRSTRVPVLLELVTRPDLH
jgi:hypothetical protein